MKNNLTSLMLNLLKKILKSMIDKKERIFQDKKVFKMAYISMMMKYKKVIIILQGY